MLKKIITSPQFHIHGTRANAIWATLTQLVEKLTGYLVIAVLTRTLLKVEIGSYFFALSIAELTSIFISFGTNKYLIRQVATEPEKSLTHLSHVFSTRIFNILVGYVLLILLFWLIQPPLLPTLMLVVGFTFIQEIYNIFGAFFIGQRKILYHFLIISAYKGTTFIFVSLIALKTEALYPVLWVFICLNAGLAMVGYILTRKIFGPIFLSIDLRESFLMMKLSAPFFLITILTVLHMRFDTILVGVFLNLQEVANYELGIKLMEVSRFLVRPLNLVFFPVFSAYLIRDQWKQVRSRFSLLMGFALVGGILLTIGMQVFGRQGIELLFGKGYEESVRPAKILFLSIVPMYVIFLCTILATAMEREKASALLLGITVIANLGLNVFLIPKFGIIGAAWTTVISQYFLMFGMLAITIPTLLHPPRSDVAPASLK